MLAILKTLTTLLDLARKLVRLTPARRCSSHAPTRPRALACSAHVHHGSGMALRRRFTSRPREHVDTIAAAGCTRRRRRAYCAIDLRRHLRDDFTSISRQCPAFATMAPSFISGK
jgi:hypothetical protein